jgi:ribosomal protein L20
MNLIKITKKEKTKTRGRKLKKRQFNQLNKVRLNTVANSVYLSYNVLLHFIEKQELGVKSNVLSNLILEEAGTTSFFSY